MIWEEKLMMKNPVAGSVFSFLPGLVSVAIVTDAAAEYLPLCWISYC